MIEATSQGVKWNEENNRDVSIPLFLKSENYGLTE